MNVQRQGLIRTVLGGLKTWEVLRKMVGLEWVI